MTTPHPFDARPLTDPIDPAELRAFGRQMRSGGLAANIVPVMMAVFGILVFAVVFVAFIGGVIASFSTGGTGQGMPFVLVSIVLLSVIAALCVLAVRRWLRPTRAFRLVKFAQANGMEFQTIARDPQLPGMIFHQGRNRVARDIVRGEHPRLVEFGNFRYETGTDKERKTHDWGYIAIRLDVPLPNIVLDATSNNGFFGSNLPEQFGRHQRLGLEGDFDRYFTLYAPEGYEQDALYLFTPDIMARFIDHAAALDVEIVDDWLLLYAQRDMTTLDPAQWAWEFSIVRRSGIRSPPAGGPDRGRAGRAAPAAGGAGARARRDGHRRDRLAGGAVRHAHALTAPPSRRDERAERDQPAAAFAATQAARRARCSTGSGTGRDANRRFV